MISARGRKGATGRRETSVVRGFGLARSTRYPYSCYLRVLPTLSLLRFERVPPPPHGARAIFPYPRAHRLAGDDRDRKAASLG